ncbi:1-acyl-sn-glycerol-3-phosphate acyltransferase [Salana multivorans]|uniref:1-acyl-sn-glycerol-3-phosphate acyltransferase n=1 Tax=Salana multivorans TaxID=120377 RepID=A0A3N2D002_9MICO|nr:lysophospholipid acyltransferase family protein [Salana multivorans]ROR93112.1 1-acyl-sn-glycerol-3-phosphate acyltransferase [Salana multivorans]
MEHTEHDYPPRHKSGHYRFIAAVVRPILNALGRKRWSGTENLPAEGGFIVASNHLCNLDPLTVAHMLYNNGAPPRILAKSELWRMPIIGPTMRHSHMIPVERGTRTAADSLVAAEAAIAHGEAVFIYPEGTHSKDPDKWPMVARTGVARLALATGAPVIPVAQWGAHLVMPNHKPWFRPWAQPKFQVLVGTPVDLADLIGRSDHEALVEATARIMRAITALLARLRGETPPEIPWDHRRGGRVVREPRPGSAEARGTDEARTEQARPGGAADEAGDTAGEDAS